MTAVVYLWVYFLCLQSLRFILIAIVKFYVIFYSYATRVRSIINDPSKNLTTKEILRLKKQVQFWKERAGNLGGEELEEVVEDRTSRSAE